MLMIGHSIYFTGRGDIMAGGRPPKEIDKEDFEKLCELQCTQAEFCCFFDCEDDTLNSWCKRTYGKSFSEVFKVKRGAGKISLRRSQWRLAETNAAMAIFLGKQYLNQRDTPQEDETSNKVIEALIEAVKNS